MKNTLFILALITASIQTFAQSPRIKLNQITKDSVTGSVLVSSPTDSGMVYSRDLYISYGADTVLILNGDTLAKTSGIISSVLSDGVTIIGNGTTGNELTADTSVLATLRALSDSLVNYVSTTELSDSTTNIRTDIPLIISDSLLFYVSRTELSDSLALISSSVTADGVTITGDGTVGSPLEVDTTTYIATKQDLDSKQDQLNGTGFVKATGTTISYDNSTYLTSEVDGDASNELQTLSYNSSTNEITLSDGGGTEDLSNLDLVDSTRINATGDTAYYYQNGVLIGTGPIAGGGGTTYNNISETVDTVYISDYLDVDTATLYVDATNNRVGIGTSSPTLAKLQIIDTSGSSLNAFRIEKGSPTQTTSGYKNALIITGYASNTTNIDANLTAALFQKTDEDGNYANFNFFSAQGNNLGGFGMNYIDHSGRVSDFYFATANGGLGTEKMRIKANGNVGIGTTSPSYKLHVNGSVAGVGAYNNLSDVNWKKNIQDITYGIDKILQLKPITFNWLNEDYGDRLNIGFIAQEVEEIIPNMVTTSEDGTKSLAITDLIPVLTKAIQEQQVIIETQATEIETLKSQIQLILNEIEQLKNN